VNTLFNQLDEGEAVVERPRIAPGWYRDISNHDYHKSEGVSSTYLKKLLEKTPAHLLHAPPFEPSDAMHVGTAVHTLVLEPDTAEKSIAIVPNLNLRTKSGREEMAAFEAASAGKTVLTPEQHDKAVAMARSVSEHPTASLLLEDVIAESSIYWWYRSRDEFDDAEYKVMCKVRPDAIGRGHNIVIDLKSCIDASYSGFIRAVQKFYYHVSAAMYLEGVNQCKPLLGEVGHLAYTKFVFICVENTPPYLVAVYELSPAYLDLGKHLFRRCLRKHHDAKAENYPGFPEDVRVLEPPAWAQRAHIV